MENQSTTQHTVICRKCGGPHFTIKCGKEKKEPEQVLHNDKPKINNKPVYEKKKYFKKVYCVKVSELPVDMTDEEMMELTYNWGHIVRVKVLNYEDSSTAYIDFGYEEEADYFIRALDKTPFEHIIISVSRAN